MTETDINSDSGAERERESGVDSQCVLESRCSSGGRVISEPDACLSCVVRLTRREVHAARRHCVISLREVPAWGITHNQQNALPSWPALDCNTRTSGRLAGRWWEIASARCKSDYTQKGAERTGLHPSNLGAFFFCCITLHNLPELRSHGLSGLHRLRVRKRTGWMAFNQTRTPVLLKCHLCTMTLCVKLFNKHTAHWGLLNVLWGLHWWMALPSSTQSQLSQVVWGDDPNVGSIKALRHSQTGQSSQLLQLSIALGNASMVHSIPGCSSNVLCDA